MYKLWRKLFNHVIWCQWGHRYLKRLTQACFLCLLSRRTNFCQSPKQEHSILIWTARFRYTLNFVFDSVVVDLRYTINNPLLASGYQREPSFITGLKVLRALTRKSESASRLESPSSTEEGKIRYKQGSRKKKEKDLIIIGMTKKN